jgi:hypothetical protein
VQNVFRWTLDVPSLFPTPYVTFMFTLYCDGGFDEKCELRLDGTGFTRTWKLIANNLKATFEFTSVGKQDLVWTFTKDSSNSSFVRTSRAVIRSMKVR